jgi:hypothetical protein
MMVLHFAGRLRHNGDAGIPAATRHYETFSILIGDRFAKEPVAVGGGFHNCMIRLRTKIRTATPLVATSVNAIGQSTRVFRAGLRDIANFVSGDRASASAPCSTGGVTLAIATG